MIGDTTQVRAASLPRVRIGSIPSAFWLGGLVAASFLARVLTSVGHRTPRLLPDEYIYFTLARSLSHGSTAIRGHAAHFPALLEPLLAAPLWLAAGGDVDTAYRLTQGLHSLVISLVAVPVFLLAKRVGLGKAEALVCAALGLGLPALVFASYVTADAVGLTLAVSAVAAGAAALERPTAKIQLAFVALTALAALARVQYVAIAFAFAVAALIVHRGRIARAATAYRITLAAVAIPTTVALGAGPRRILGYYAAVTDLRFHPGAVGHWLAIHGLLLAYAAGWVLVPVALVGLGYGLMSSRSRAELAFAAMTASLAAVLLLEASVYAANGSARFHERYLIALLPMTPILFFCGARRLDGRGARRTALAAAGGLLLVAGLVPLAPYAGSGSNFDSPTLQALADVNSRLGIDNRSLVIGSVAGALALAAAAAAWSPRRGLQFLVPLALVTTFAASAGAVDVDHHHAGASQRALVGPGIADASRLGAVSVLETPRSDWSHISEQLFWNTSLQRILKMNGADDVDAFGSTPVSIARDGRLVAAGKTVTSPLLVEQYDASVILDDARLVHVTPTSALWAPSGPARIAMLTVGRYLDGWLEPDANVTVWPKANGPRHGVLRLAFALPQGVSGTTVTLRAPGVVQSIRITAGRERVVSLPVRVRTPWRLQLHADRSIIVPGGRVVAVLASVPVFAERA